MRQIIDTSLFGKLAANQTWTGLNTWSALGTFTGGLISSGAGTDSTRLGPSNTATGTETIAVGKSNSSANSYNYIFGSNNTSSATGGAANGSNLILGSFNTVDKFDLSNAANIVLGFANVVSGRGNFIVGSSSIAGAAAAAGDESDYNFIFDPQGGAGIGTNSDNNLLIGGSSEVGNSSSSNVLIGNLSAVGNSVSNSILIGNGSSASHSSAVIIGNSLASTAANDFQLGDSSALYKMAGVFPDNNTIRFGTAGDATIYYDGTNLILNPDVVGAGKVSINGAYTLPNTDGTANYILKTDGAGSVSWQPDTGGAGSPGGSSTEIQYNNAGAFGGSTGLHWLSGTSEFQFDDNILASFGTGSDATIYYDGADLIVTPNVVGTGELHVGLNGTCAMLVDRIGLGGTATSTNFWINFTQTTNKGRGALNFNLTYTGSNPQSNVLSAITFQGTGAAPASPIAYPFLSQLTDDIDHSGTANYGNYVQFGTSGTRTITQGIKNFWGWRIENSLGVGSGAHTGGDIRQYGIWIGSFNDYTGVASQLKHGIYCAENISTKAGQKIVFDSTTTAMGDTYMGYIGASTELVTYINNVQESSIQGDRKDLYLPPTRMGISKGATIAIFNGWGM